MTNQEFRKLNVYDKVKVVMNQPLSEMECRDQALSVLESYYDDFGFTDMENQIGMMAQSYNLIAEESGIDYGGVEMQNLIKSQAEALSYMEKDIRNLSKKYREEMLGLLNDFKSEIANLQESGESEDNETYTENPELNESIEKIKSNFKRFL